MYIAIDDIAITHLVFDEEFTNAIERKQVAQQDVERVKVRPHFILTFLHGVMFDCPLQFDVQKAEQEKQAAIIRSEGESEAAKILTSALTVGPALLELRRLEAAKEIASTLAKSPNVIFVPNHGNMILNVPKP
jgi:prohibitin 1